MRGLGNFLAKGVAGLLLALLLFIAMGGAMSALSGDPKPRGDFVDIGGRRLHIVCAGPKGGGPTVIFESGAFGFSADWAAVQAKLAAKGLRSCAYDRAGLGFSDPGPAPRDGLAIVSDLEKLIAASGERGPFILVGHSMAGLHLRHFAARNPKAVAGLVLVDAATPESMDSPMVRRFVGQFGGLSRAAVWLAGAGLLKPLAGLGLADQIDLPPAAAAEKRWTFGLISHNAAASDEVRQWSQAADQARRAGDYDPALPVAVVLAGAPEGREGWKAAQSLPARASRHGSVENVPGANHASVLGFAHNDAIVRAIEHVRTALTPAGA